jgi:hypothetical protein
MELAKMDFRDGEDVLELMDEPRFYRRTDILPVSDFLRQMG